MMSSGFTDPIQKFDDYTFEEFAWHVASEFFHDTSEVPDTFEVGNYYSDALARIEVEIAKLEAMTPEEVEAQIEAEYQEALKQYHESVLEHDRVAQRVVAMREKIQAWVPPSSDHEGLKRMMLSQLDDFVNANSLDFPKSEAAPEREIAAYYKRQKLQGLRRSETIYREGHQKEVAKVARQNAYVAKLREALGPKPPRRKS